MPASTLKLPKLPTTFTGYVHRTFDEIHPNRDKGNHAKALEQAEELAEHLRDNNKQARDHTYYGFLGYGPDKRFSSWKVQAGGCFGSTKYAYHKNFTPHYFIYDCTFLARALHTPEVLEAWVDYVINRSPMQFCFVSKDAKTVIDSAAIVDSSWPFDYLMQSGVLLRAASMAPYRVEFWYKFKEVLGEDLACAAMFDYAFLDSTKQHVVLRAYTDGHALHEYAGAKSVEHWLYRDFSNFKAGQYSDGGQWKGLTLAECEGCAYGSFNSIWQGDDYDCYRSGNLPPINKDIKVGWSTFKALPAEDFKEYYLKACEVAKYVREE